MAGLAELRWCRTRGRRSSRWLTYGESTPVSVGASSTSSTPHDHSTPRTRKRSAAYAHVLDTLDVSGFWGPLLTTRSPLPVLAAPPRPRRIDRAAEPGWDAWTRSMRELGVYHHPALSLGLPAMTSALAPSSRRGNPAVPAWRAGRLRRRVGWSPETYRGNGGRYDSVGSACVDVLIWRQAGKHCRFTPCLGRPLPTGACRLRHCG